MPQKSDYHYPGIYKFTNKVNGKVYIGQAVNIYRRLKHHRRLKCPFRFGHALRKYGFEGFYFEVLERVDDLSKLNQREQYWMDFYQCYQRDKGYNVSPTAGSPRGKKATAKQIETTRARGLAQIGEKNPFFGRKHTEETKKRISEAHKGKVLTPSHRASLSRPQPPGRIALMTSLAIKKVRKKIAQIEPHTGHVLRIWDSVRCIHNELGLSKFAIGNMCRGPHYHKSSHSWQGRQDALIGGYRWAYISSDGVIIEHNKPEIPPKKLVNKVAQIDPVTGEVKRIWDSAIHVRGELGLHPVLIRSACRGYYNANKNKYPLEVYAGFKWQYVAV